MSIPGYLGDRGSGCATFVTMMEPAHLWDRHAAHQVLPHATLADVDAELGQLAMNPRSALEMEVGSHGS
jgi:hypothetical protein